ncbi:MAG: hypothetical protein NWR72_08025 [Bacteroidia bacterium]|nr:hypothetical protein [Bacteroidia bacterium]
MEILQYAHSYLRWVVLALALVVIAKALIGWLGRKPYEKLDNTLGASFLGSIHLQLVLGLILYFIGDKGLALITANGMGAVMKDATLRFWAVEHITTMIIAVVVATVGRSMIKRAGEPGRKHRLAAIYFIIATVLILSRVPWSQVPLFKGM